MSSAVGRGDSTDVACNSTVCTAPRPDCFTRTVRSPGGTSCSGSVSSTSPWLLFFQAARALSAEVNRVVAAHGDVRRLRLGEPPHLLFRVGEPEGRALVTLE